MGSRNNQIQVNDLWSINSLTLSINFSQCFRENNDYFVEESSLFMQSLNMGN